jgi:hypothetical protein
MEDIHSLDFFAHTTTDPSQPSWTPSFTIGTVWEIAYTEDLSSQFNADKAGVPHGMISADGLVLCMTGKSLSKIVNIGRVCGASEFFDRTALARIPHAEDPVAELVSISSRSEVKDWFHECCSIAHLDSNPLPSSRRREMALTLIWNSDFKGFRIDDAFPDRFFKLFQMREEISVDCTPEWWREYQGVATAVELPLGSSARNRRLCSTHDGRLGSVPAGAKVGDKICMLYGGRVLYVIRACGNGQYKFIGECYVHGLMEGEAMDAGHEDEEFALV